MTVAEHASNILEAWTFQDRSGLGSALDKASIASTSAQPVSRLESEREEMLQSIVEHLRGLATEELPESNKAGGALRLLSHLSSPVMHSGISG